MTSSQCPTCGRPGWLHELLPNLKLEALVGHLAADAARIRRKALAPVQRGGLHVLARVCEALWECFSKHPRSSQLFLRLACTRYCTLHF